MRTHLLVAALVAAQAVQTQGVQTPAAGSPTRRAILDALRTRIKTSSRFRVDHVRTWNAWAFVRATELVIADGEEQETDLTAAALLERPAGSTRWIVREVWTLPTDEEHSLAAFKRRIAALRTAKHLPASLFPADL